MTPNHPLEASPVARSMGMPVEQDMSSGAAGARNSQLLAQLVESVTDYAIFALDPSGIVTTWNPGARRLKGYNADEIIGKHFSSFYTDVDLEAGKPARELAIATAEGRYEEEGWRVRQDGSRFWANVVITAIRGQDDRLVGFGKVTRDLTERKRNDDALRGVLAREQDAAAQLREADQLRTELVAVIAHDLRGPVGVLQNLVHLLEVDGQSLDDETRRELFERIKNRLGIMGALADDVFDVSRIEAGQLSVDLAAIDLAAAVDRVVVDTRLSFPDRTIEVTAQGPVAVRADERRLWEVLSNLLSNALKFSSQRTVVSIAISTDGGDGIVSIADEGPGIPLELQDQLFQRFVRLPPTNSAPGSGLGLFIAKSLTEAMGGRIWVDSTPGIGSTFHVALQGAA